jgi:pimeloyl-ACP methyl ester carboxylesterase
LVLKDNDHAPYSTRRWESFAVDSWLGRSMAVLEFLLNDLAAQREVIAVDLPGFGQTPRLRFWSRTNVAAEVPLPFSTWGATRFVSGREL